MGTRYAGFQSQDGKLTVQATIESAASAVTQEQIRIQGAGRTDAGAHALGQIVSFTTESRLAVDVLARAINHYLPADVAVQEIWEAPLAFHPRYDASSRLYRYLIWNNHTRSPLWNDRAAHVPTPLDVEAMDAAAKQLLGRHDFSAFVAAAAEGSRVRTMYRAACSRDGDLVTVELEAGGFRRQMARAIVGTLILVGQSKLAKEDVGAILKTRDRAQAGETAPAAGLYLVEVRYDQPADAERPSPRPGDEDEENE